jgi:tetratricopeptide (TPR) repeat protein
MSTTVASGYDLFLSHATPDKAWVRTLQEELHQQGLRAFLDERAFQPGDNYVLGLSDGLRHSRFLILVLTPQSATRPWVVHEWTAFMAEHGPVGRILVLVLEPVELPTILKPLQCLDATHRDAARVARELAALVGRPGELKPGDARRLYFGQHLVFVLERAGERLAITDTTGRRREVTPPWQGDNRFFVAFLGFNKLTREPVDSDAGRAELTGHATTLGTLLFELLFDDQGVALLHQATIPGQPQPLITLRSAADELLALPWELLHHDGSFLVRDGRVDLARSTLGEVGPGALLRAPAGFFKLVVNVSAPEGSGLHYEAESYRITRALSECCTLVPTELGTLEDLIETVKRERPTGIHFSGHGGPGQLLFEDDEGREAAVSIRDLVQRLRARVTDGLPPFFYLASRHGNEPAPAGSGERPPSGRALDAGAESSAARLHREGVAQVVGYYGPIVDELSTRAEEALYAAIAEGESTCYAVRQARMALVRSFHALGDQHRPPVKEEGAGAAAEATDPSLATLRRSVEDRPERFSEASLTRQNQPERGAEQTPAHTHPFAWAQLVFYHRGPDQPLSLPVPREQRRQVEKELHRTMFPDTGRQRVLRTGFIGRRTELHRVRRRLRRGERVFVFQGLGGLGKTTLAFHVLPLLGGPDDRCTLWCQETAQEHDRAEALVGQLLEYCRKRFGAAWEAVVQQVDRTAGDDPVQRFAYYLGALLQKVPRLVLYLDNLESLLVGPDETSADEAAFGTWQAPALAGIWQVLRQGAAESGKLWVVASCRYRHPDFAGALMPVSALPPDAMYRLMGWFPALRRLASATRAKLVARLAGHPRAAEYANDLIGHQLAQYEDDHGEWRLPERPGDAALQREWDTLVELVLPKVRERLWANLLLEEIWKQVLDDRGRRMLYRMTLLRRPWAWDLMTQLGEPEEVAATAQATARRLSQSSLLEQVDLGEERRYTLHPATAQFIRTPFGHDALLRHETHRRVGDYLEAHAKNSPDIEVKIEAGHHLLQAGEYDRANKLLGSASRWLQNHGRVREGLDLLKPFLDEPVRKATRPKLVGQLLETVGFAYYRLSQVKQSIGYYERALDIDREIGNRRGEGNALGRLGLAYAALGETKKAVRYHQKRLDIAKEIGNRQGEGNARGNLGVAYKKLGETKKAIGYHKQHLAIAQQIGDRRGKGNALGNLGDAYLDLGKVNKAIDLYKQALAINREIGNRRSEGRALCGLGRAYANLGKVNKAIDLYEQALTISREIGNRRGQGNALGRLGRAYANLGETAKAMGFYKQALAINQEIGNRGGEGTVLGNLGLAYADLGQVDKAIGVLEQALRIGQEIKDPQITRNVSANLERLRGTGAP